MMYGIIASESHVTLPQLPAPTGAFNFVNGTYDWGGTSLTAGQVTDQTGWIDAGGLSIPASQSASAALIYSAATTFLAGCNFTAAFEVETLSTSNALVFTISNDGETYFVQFEWQNSWNLYDDDDGSHWRWAEESANGLTVGIHSIAFSRQNSAISMSVDGHPVVQDNSIVCTLPVLGFPMTKFYFGGWSGETLAAIKIRSASFYDLQSDSDLPGLSA